VPRRRHPVAALDDRAALQAGSLWWAYLRHSPGETQDLASQRRAVREFAEGRGLLIVRYFADAGQSGSSTEGRTAFDALVEASRVQPRPVAGLLLWAFSRLARNELDAQFYKADLRRRGFAIVSVTEEIPADVGLIVESVIDFANRKFLETITKDTRRGLRETVLRELQVDGRTVRGFSVGGFPPRGYRAVRVQTGTRRNGEPRYNSYWELDPDCQEKVAAARAMFAAGEPIMAVHERTGLFPSLSSYRAILVNPIYAGDLVAHGVTIRDNHPARVSREVWDRVQARLRERRHNQVTAAERPDLLGAGLLFCGECGTRMVHKLTRGGTVRQYGVWGCRLRYDRRCSARGISDLALERELRRALAGLRLPSASEIAASAERLARERSEDSGAALRINDLEAEVSRLRATEGRLIDMRAGGEISRTQFAERVQSARRQLADAQASLRALKAESSDPDLAGQVAWIGKAAEMLAAGEFDPGSLRVVVRVLIERVTAGPERKVTIAWRPGVEALLGEG
jgi:hypothetical protein